MGVVASRPGGRVPGASAHRPEERPDSTGHGAG